MHARIHHMTLNFHCVAFVLPFLTIPRLQQYFSAIIFYYFLWPTYKIRSMISDQKEVINGMERRIKVAEILVPDEAKTSSRIMIFLKAFIVGLASKVWKFLHKAWDMGVDDPRKVIHCLKVGIAVTVVSIFYYVRHLYVRLGEADAIWAIMTVVVVFENTVGKYSNYIIIYITLGSWRKRYEKRYLVNYYPDRYTIYQMA
jgi:hypothetical protein